jgi:hypothetical protein
MTLPLDQLWKQDRFGWCQPFFAGKWAFLRKSCGSESRRAAKGISPG